LQNGSPVASFLVRLNPTPNEPQLVLSIR